MEKYKKNVGDTHVYKIIHFVIGIFIMKTQ